MADSSVLHDDNNIERLFRNILNHPTFRATVNQILHNANSNIRISTEESVGEVRGIFASPAIDFSSLFQQGRSSNNNSATPVIQKAAARSEVSSRLSLISPMIKRKHKQVSLISTRYQLPTEIFPLSKHEQQ